MKQSDFQLAYVRTPKDKVVGWFASEKMDGMRAGWDGRNLYSRQGNLIHAPEGWKAMLPKSMRLDGELWSPVKPREEILSIVKRTVNINPEDWVGIQFHVFDTFDTQRMFSVRNRALAQVETGVVHIVKQTLVDSEEHLSSMFDKVIAKGGEGLMLKSPWNIYSGGRTRDLLKVKPLNDTVVTVIGATSAKEGKIQGLFGNLIVREDATGHEFEVSGFTDDERLCSNTGWCYDNPGKVGALPIRFPKGVKIEVKFSGRNVSGIPNTARYFRKEDL